jgi:hypothetical protein
MSKKPWENDSCEAVQAYFTVYRVPVAAALWCGIPVADVEDHLSQCQEVVKGILKHPYIHCLEPRCRAIHDAIVKGLLPCSRENGKVVPTQEHVAADRRHVSRQHLKDWIAATFPTDKPEFLFDAVERNVHPAISVEAFQALQADRHALEAKLETARDEYRKLRDERNQLSGDLQALQEQTQHPKLPGPRSETTYLNIIGAMLAVMLNKNSAGKANSVFENQSAVISNIVAHYGAKPGISQRNLEEKFSEAKRSLSQ